MALTMPAQTPRGANINIGPLRVPDRCPRCHRHVDPKANVAALSADQRDCEVVFRCPAADCTLLFLVKYELHDGGWLLRSFAPISPVKPIVPECVREISPQFLEVYTQSLAAEANQLDQIVGIGLRKALEFLVKDFLIREHAAAKDGILRAQLGTCINNYVTDANLKKCAERAAWLGNDETHYLRKWEDKDIEDLKILVKLTLNWIENVVLTKQYEAAMPAPPSGAAKPAKP